jgi:hypothetical protein
MAKKLSTFMPLLYIFQPQTEVGELKMQSRFSFKVHDKKEKTDQDLSELEHDASAPVKMEDAENIPPVQLIVEDQLEAMNPDKRDSKKTADPQLVNMFLKTLMPKANEKLIKNIQEGNLEEQEEVAESKSKNEANSSKSADVQVDSEIKKIISRLARYPNVMKRPMCEAKIGGKKQRFQVESKRGELVKIKSGENYYHYSIADFAEFTIL